MVTTLHGERRFEIRLPSTESEAVILFDDQTLSQAQVFESDSVLQTALDPYILRLPPESLQPNTDQPLLSLRHTLILPSHRSVLGFMRLMFGEMRMLIIDFYNSYPTYTSRQMSTWMWMWFVPDLHSNWIIK